MRRKRLACRADPAFSSTRESRRMRIRKRGMSVASGTRATTSHTTRTLGAGRAMRIDALLEFVDTARVARKYKAGWFEEIETELHRRVADLECDLTAEVMEHHDVDAAAIEVAGKEHRSVPRAAQTLRHAGRAGCGGALVLSRPRR